MSITIDAVYENGILRPKQPLPLKDQQTVQVTIHTEISWARQTAGLMGWTGSDELAERFASDPELEYPPFPEDQ